MWIWHENRILCIYFTGFNQCQYCVALAVATAAANSIHHKSNSINYFAMWLQHCTVRVSVWIMKCVASFQCKNDAYANYFVFSASTSGFLGKFMLSSQVKSIHHTLNTLYIFTQPAQSASCCCVFSRSFHSLLLLLPLLPLSWLWFIRLAYDPNVSTPNQWKFFHIFVLFRVKTGTNVSRVIDRVWNRFSSLFSLLYLSYFDLIAIAIVRYRCGVRFFHSSCHTRNHQTRFLAWYWTAVPQVDMNEMGERFAYN